MELFTTWRGRRGGDRSAGPHKQNSRTVGSAQGVQSEVLLIVAKQKQPLLIKKTKKKYVGLKYAGLLKGHIVCKNFAAGGIGCTTLRLMVCSSKLRSRNSELQMTVTSESHLN